MSGRPLLFITNLNNDDQGEDIFLFNYLKSFFNITLADITDATNLLPNFFGCIVRNAWPSRLFVNEFEKLEKICKDKKIKIYNPVHRHGYTENKTYLVGLFNAGLPVIPTAMNADSISKHTKQDKYFIKPINGSSSFGVEQLTAEELKFRKLDGYIVQPFMDFRVEVSFYFIDDQFTYATVSAGPGKRWELSEYSPKDDEINWAERFVEWNKLPYGLQRIDACRMPDGQLYLMEIEDMMPFLSLDILPAESIDIIFNSFVKSIKRHLYS